MYCSLKEKGCGGCSQIDLMYGETLKNKDAQLHRLFPGAEKILGCEMPLHYRNKVLRTFADGKQSLYSGIYRAGTHQVLSMRDCCLEDQLLGRIAHDATDLLGEMGLKAYREDFRRGQLRHMILRRTPRQDQVLLTLVTGVQNVPGLDLFAEKIMRLYPQVKGVIQNVNDRDSSAVLGFQSRLILGRDEIWDRLCDLQICLSSKSFYQVNAPQAEKLYTMAVEKAGLTKEDCVLDAYCGVGAIGMLAARQAGQVTGIEIVKDAILCANKAKKKNAIENINFLQGDVKKALRLNEKHFSCIFLDPPRSGLERSFLDALCDHAPERIAYVSCNPVTLRRDLSILEEKGYRADFVRGVDMFPFTEHVETVCLLSKINS